MVLKVLARRIWTLVVATVQVGSVCTVTLLLLYAIAHVTAQQVDVETLAPSTPATAIELNRRNQNMIHSGPGIPTTGRPYGSGD